jgi:hypothetical protein
MGNTLDNSTSRKRKEHLPPLKRVFDQLTVNPFQTGSVTCEGLERNQLLLRLMFVIALSR